MIRNTLIEFTYSITKLIEQNRVYVRNFTTTKTTVAIKANMELFVITA